MPTIDLFSELKKPHLQLKNRMAMAPLTRSRATADNIPTPIMATYYAQRASAGLIISEAAPIEPLGIGYARIPGIFNKKQIEAWKPVVEAVHQQNSVFFMQLWHVGRNSHSDFHGRQPVSASDIPISGQKQTPKGWKDFEKPRPLTPDQISQTVEAYAQAAANAREAGFDGVEIHAANGYLPEQFLAENVNHRTDEYGGSVENRIRFVMEITDAVCKTIGTTKTGIRLSPAGISGDIVHANPKNTFTKLITALNKFDLAYLHVMEALNYKGNVPEHYIKNVTAFARPLWNNTLITNAGFTKETGNTVLQNQLADVVAFGRLFISNPDLPQRFAQNAILTPPDKDTLYTSGAKGYTDYPTLS